MSVLDSFFNLGNRVTKGDPTRKALFDYCLYWIVFLAFVFIATNYYYSYFFKGASASTLMWGVVITIFCWFNYWGLVAFRSMYKNMKDAQNIINKSKVIVKPNKEEVKGMMEEFNADGK